ncbi:SRPBCC family protein [Actinomadura mexicana]|uniref:Carbon monoxide dehydrogenase subunit G n=1 Tax=Actinomadura mexicana TaxID=134959 RepID=A0A239CE61_9ACTN|nr:SRPBCC family protein [Actinomadura mexicana]SNS17774.1 Carbon monoxide dehydrogenase subunit G [Actinomadura mexicana]
MELDHDFTVPVPVDQAWSVLLDVERVAACMPGATLDSVDGEEYSGRMKVKVGAMTITYRGTARIVSADESSRVVTMEASAKEARGSGTAAATVQARLHGEDGVTRVTVHTKLNVTGRPAQFGRNILSEVGSKIIARFARQLAAELEAPGETAAEAPAAAAAPVEKPTEKPVEKPTRKPPGKPAGKPAEATADTPVSAAVAPADTPAAARKGPEKAAEPEAEAETGAAPAAPEEPADKPGPVEAEPGERPSLHVAGDHEEGGRVQPVEEKDDAIDLLEFVGPSIAKRAVPAVGGLVAALLAVRFLVRRRKKR